MKPKTLHKCNANEILEKELYISVKNLILIFLICLIFVGLCIMMQGPTYGYL